MELQGRGSVISSRLSTRTEKPQVWWFTVYIRVLDSSHCRAEQPGVRPLSSQARPEIGTWARTRDLGRPRKGPRSRSFHTELCGGLESGKGGGVPSSLPQVLSAKNCLLKRQSRTLANYEFQKEKSKSNAYGIRCPQSCLREIQI